MNCTHCGTLVIGGNKFCGRCGAQVMNAAASPPRTCSQCGVALKPAMKFCVSCGNVTGNLPSPPSAVPPARPSAYDSLLPTQISPSPGAPHYFGSAPGTAPAKPADPFGSANQAVQSGSVKSSVGQKISLSAALFGVICFFLPWVEVSCMGMRKAASGLQLATDVNLPEVWLVLLAMFAGVGIVAVQLLSRAASAPVDKLLSLALVGIGFLPLAVCLFEWLRFTNDISKMKSSDSYGLGRIMGNAIESSVSYEFGGILTIACALGLIVGGLLHLKDSRSHPGSP